MRWYRRLLVIFANTGRVDVVLSISEGSSSSNLWIIFNIIQNSKFSSALIREICRFQKTHHRRICQLFSIIFKNLNSHQLSSMKYVVFVNYFQQFSKFWILISSHLWNLSISENSSSSILSIIFNIFQNSEFSSALIVKSVDFRRLIIDEFVNYFQQFFKIVNSHQLSSVKSVGSSSLNLSVFPWCKVWVSVK